MTRTAGIDLSASHKTTAICEIEWDGLAGRVRLLEETAGTDIDEPILRTIRRASRTGIDAPFGWPVDFIKAITSHEAGRRWPGRGLEKPEEFRRSLRFRRTDLALDITPLSVSTEKIGVTAMRNALILDRAVAEGLRVDRSGQTGKACEVYPAAALHRWGIDRTGYKAKDAIDIRRRVLAQVKKRFPRLEVPTTLARTDHAVDAFVSAIVAKAVLDKQTDRPRSKQDKELARVEGWIHVPAEGWPA